MSDYSFMRSGRGAGGNTNSDPFGGFSQEDIKILLSLFVSNAMINAAKYSKICDRNGITKEDVEYGLKYEVIEFFNRDDLMEGYDEIKRDMEEEMERDNENIKYGVDYIDTRLGTSCEHEEVFDTLEEVERWIEENSCEYYDNMEIFEIEPDPMEEHIVEDDEIEDFVRMDLTKVAVEDMGFVQKLHKYHDEWKTWQPETPLKEILKNGVDQINKNGI
jgi:hypothetical protein